MRYVVKTSDTLNLLGQRFGVTVEQIMAVNPQITDPNLIVPGQAIIIPQQRPDADPDFPEWGQRPPQWGPRPPQWGPRPPQWGPRPPQWGPRPPFWGPRPPFWGPRPPFWGPRPPVGGPRPPQWGSGFIVGEDDLQMQQGMPGPIDEGLIGREGFGVLRRGSQGPEVRLLQDRLVELGYYKGTVNGVYGRQTEQAVRKFQKKMGFPETGTVEDVTWAALGF